MPHPADDILRVMQSPSSEDRKAIEEAYEFAKIAHGDEKRKSGEPYIIHPHAIAVSLASLGMGRETIIAGILHDTIEDTAVTSEEIEEKFGKEIRTLVEGVTKLSKLKYRGSERHVESLRRLLVATANDIRVIIIKLADRLHNMETIQYVTPIEKRNRIAMETKEIYVPIAERLGIGFLKAKLEDLSFKTLEPERYKEMNQFLTERGEKEKDSLQRAVNDLKKALAEAGIRSFHTESRVKNVHSFSTKIKRKDNDPDKVYDLFAIRVIVPTLEDCYRALGVVHNIWRPVPARVKDFIATPKSNGYRTIHTTIITPYKLIMEIQIRSEEMQRESKFGVAAHFLYKNSDKNAGSRAGWVWRLVPSLMKMKGKGSAETEGTSESAPTPGWLKDLNRAAEEFSGEEAFEQALKDDFFAVRIFTFTPKGDAIDLPVGATAVDFAYAVHTHLVDVMKGAKVNGKLVSLDTPLKNGDVVEIETKKHGIPNRKWLEFAKSSAARSYIRASLKKHEASNT
ncbi:bifunctional (p)ppGpp synthetase/guanosine-3',5'-bis(diphosphate) 3'-pyrophosphohydrolase [Patescibacteria group bacterium]|nr:MAG: bifunctional (p)ppGpp synthetase/guanosine-3',5'-bis(diphosphate) 3'-pyrophosphohydrolase [Patescibacteria group bacterium]